MKSEDIQFSLSRSSLSRILTGISKYTINALALFNGDFNNQKQVDEPGNENAFIQYKAVPVDAPALGSGPVIYEEWTANGVIQSMKVLLVSEQPGPSIRVDIYNVTDPSYYKPGEFNVSSLRNFKLKDLRGGNCTGTYKKLTELVYVGYFPDCEVLIEGNNPGFGDTFTCNAYGSVLPPTDPNFRTAPYILNRIGDRYPLFGFPDNFNKICGQKKYPKKTRPKYQ
ncbi:hypothetical protein BsWGS_23338 [Bradybaena similaris]